MNLNRFAKLIRSRRKVRAGWSKSFRHARLAPDGLSTMLQMANKFDGRDWQW
jgi:hypothetical protein